MAAPSVSSGFFSVPARFGGHVIARVHAPTHSVWAWRAPRAGERVSPACLFWPVSHAHAASALARAAVSLGMSAVVKPASSCAVFATGPMAGWHSGPVVKVRLPGKTKAASARRALLRAWLGL